MRLPFRFFCTACTALLLLAPALQGQASTSLPSLPFDTSGPVIQAHTEALKPFTVAGEHGVLLGQQDGTFEAWMLPVKVLSHLTIEADVEGYTVPIDVNQQSAEIEVRPDRTVITYSHIAFTVRQIMFSPDAAIPGTGPVVLFEFDCLHPTDFTLRFTPELRWMWPERNEGVPGAEWVRGFPLGSALHPPTSDDGGDGFYVLHTDYPDFAAAITIPGAHSGILAPYQERPQVHPVELKLHIDPMRDHGRLFPLLMAVGTTVAAANTASLRATLEQQNAGIAAAYQAHANKYKQLLANATSIETPDKSLDQAFQWAVVSIEQLRAQAKGTGETALVAGYYASGDSARPGFGWFFGRDALYTLYAVNGYGDFALSKSELEFLIHRQRDDGKIMHEYSQTAPDIDWKAFPYMYAAADATPLFLLAVEDYVKASGDTAFLTANREAIEKAWAFEIDPAHDTDHDGIYDNSQGTGWVESWPGGMPHQEIYLALLDQQASGAMATIEKLLGDAEKSSAAQQRADTIAKTIESEYYDPQKDCYAFSHNPDGSQDRTSTVYPAMAWWSDLGGAKPVLAHPNGCLQQFAAHTLATDWGLRDLSSDEKIYDGMSYHQGSVWPLFTGWAALAEYRANQPLTGYQLLKENSNLTWAQDLGADTELLSGDFFVPFGRSTSHQLWSSAMVVTPILRGLFGISIDAQTKTISVNPHLPAGWDHATVRHISVGDSFVDLLFTQAAGALTVSVEAKGDGQIIRLASPVADAKAVGQQKLTLPRRPVELGPMFMPPLPGSRTENVRVLREDYADHRLTLTMEGMAGSDASLSIYKNDARARVALTGAELAPPAEGQPQAMVVRFPAGDGWKTITVTLRW